jgi:uncharacterized protein (TIGR03790 family)
VARLLARTFASVVAAAVLVSSAHAAIDRNTLAILINDADPFSREVGEYYARARDIPLANRIHLRIPNNSNLPRAAFNALKIDLASRLPDRIQAVAAIWLRPYRVDCMSITSALAFGFDERFCASGCMPTQPSALYDSPTSSPYTDFGIRPAMLVAAGSVAAAKAMIDRGVAASVGERDSVGAYLMTTGDRNRDIRGTAFRHLVDSPPHRVIPIPGSSFPTGASNVMFYFTGATRVAGSETLQFVPGAIADHVTSWGGIFDQDQQMTALAWIDAGATGSYGTVVEPCSIPGKFPDPDVLVRRYASGAPLIEAYWESVGMPGQGLFVGEPLAQPFRRK